MQRIIGTVSLGLALMFLASGCGSSPEAVYKEHISQMNEVASVMESSKSFKDAKPKLDAITKQMETTQKKIDELNLPDAKKKEIEKKLEPEYAKAIGRTGEAFKKLMTADPAGLFDGFDFGKLQEVKGGKKFNEPKK